jgi:hypothetical protein
MCSPAESPVSIHSRSSPGPKAPLQLKEERLDFTSHWTAKEEDYPIEKAIEGAINELVASVKCEEC